MWWLPREGGPQNSEGTKPKRGLVGCMETCQSDLLGTGTNVQRLVARASGWHIGVHGSGAPGVVLRTTCTSQHSSPVHLGLAAGSGWGWGPQSSIQHSSGLDLSPHPHFPPHGGYCLDMTRPQGASALLPNCGDPQGVARKPGETQIHLSP